MTEWQRFHCELRNALADMMLVDMINPDALAEQRKFEENAKRVYRMLGHDCGTET